jgi:UDP-N-acetylmuramyl tripeptide synthase
MNRSASDNAHGSISTSVASALGRAAKKAIKLVAPDRGTNMPGRIALAVDSRSLRSLSSRLDSPVVLVSGTNGKTTTNAIVAEVFSAVTGRVITNTAGANLKPGLVSALLDSQGAPACFEVDEGALPSVLEECRPDQVVLLNLTRDQLDRYGEIDTVAARWFDGLSFMGDDLTVIANADDPRIAHIGIELQKLPNKPRTVFFGVEASPSDDSGVKPSPDAAACPSCGANLSYAVAYPTGGGHYCCESCGFSRPPLEYAASDYESLGMQGSRIVLESPSGSIKARFPLPGFGNLYNALAASAAAIEAGLSASTVEKSLEATKSAYGRFEAVTIDGRRAFLLLSKNPQSLSQNLRLVRYEAERSGGPQSQRSPLIFALNDRAADGRDVSWIWDVDFAELLGYKFAFVVCGDRAESAALRIAYDGWETAKIATVRDPYHALCIALANAPRRWAVPVLATYTAMRTLRSELVRRGYAIPIENYRR